MAKQEIICAVDLGSAQVSCVAGRYDRINETIEVIAGSKVHCRGITGGVVVDISEAALGIKKAVEEVEEKMLALIQEVEELGGMAKAIEQGLRDLNLLASIHQYLNPILENQLLKHVVEQ